MPESSRAILVAGEAIVDLIPVDASPGGSYACVLGGSGFNTAIGLGRLAAPVAFCSTLSSDANGRRFAAALTGAGVELAPVRSTSAPSPLAFVAAGTAIEGPQYSFYLAATAFDEPPALPVDLGQTYSHLHTSSFFALIGSSGAAMLRALREFRSRVSISFDPNIRPAMLPDRTEAVRLVEQRVELATLVKMSDEDLSYLYPGRDPLGIARAWAAAGPSLVVLTRGADGATACFGSDCVDVPPMRVEVADTVGAGDSFMAALLATLHTEGRLGPAALAPTRESVPVWLAVANRAAGMTCSRRGADPPTRLELFSVL